MSKTTLGSTTAAALAVAAIYTTMVLLGEVPHAASEPLGEVCTNFEFEQHQACGIGYVAMFQARRADTSCTELYERDAELYLQRGNPLLQPDFMAGCEAAERQLAAQAAQSE